MTSLMDVWWARLLIHAVSWQRRHVPPHSSQALDMDPTKGHCSFHWGPPLHFHHHLTQRTTPSPAIGTLPILTPSPPGHFFQPMDYGETGHWHFDLAPPPPPKATPRAAPQAPCPPPTASERWPVRPPVEGGQAKVLFQSSKVGQRSTRRS